MSRITKKKKKSSLLLSVSRTNTKNSTCIYINQPSCQNKWHFCPSLPPPQFQGPLWVPVHTARATEPWPKGKLSAPRYIGTVVMTEPGTTVHFPRCWSWRRGAVQQVYFFLFASCQTQWKAQGWPNKSAALNGLLNWWLQPKQVPPSLKPRTGKTKDVFHMEGKRESCIQLIFFLIYESLLIMVEPNQTQWYFIGHWWKLLIQNVIIYMIRSRKAKIDGGSCLALDSCGLAKRLFGIKSR